MDRDLNIFQNAKVDLRVNGGPTDIGALLGSYDSVILKPNKKGSKNVLERWMMSSKHTKYIVKYDFTLEDKIIEIPEDCIIEIDCGSLQHGTLVGNETILINTNNVDNALVDITLNGTWKDIEESTVTPFKLSTVITPANGRFTKERISADIDTAIACGFKEIVPILMYYFQNNHAYDYYDKDFEVSGRTVHTISFNDYLSLFNERGIKVKALKAQYFFSGESGVTASGFQEYVNLLKQHYNAFMNAGHPIEEVFILNEYTNIVNNVTHKPLSIDDIYVPLAEAVQYFRDKGVKVVFNLVPYGFFEIDPRIWDLADIVGVDIYYKIRFISSDIEVKVRDVLDRCIGIINSHGKPAMIAEFGPSDPSDIYQPSRDMMIKMYDVYFGVAKNYTITRLNNYSIYMITDYNLSSEINKLIKYHYYG